MGDDFIAKVRGVSPFPWSYITHPNGLVQVIDAAGKEVPLFTLIEYACFISNVMNKQPKQEAV